MPPRAGRQEPSVDRPRDYRFACSFEDGCAGLRAETGSPVSLPGRYRDAPSTVTMVGCVDGAPRADQGVGIEKDQRRSLRFLLKRNPSARHCHCQTPLATAGSTISMIGLRRLFFVAAWGSGCTRNRTPRRSMITASPRSAASRRRENRCFAVAVVNRFISHTIQFSNALAKGY